MKQKNTLYIIFVVLVILVAGYFIFTTIVVKEKNNNQTISSELPILIIDTFNKEVKDEPKIEARITIINNKYNNLNYISDIPENELYVGIEIRGNVSKMIPKKSYGFEVRDKKNKDLNISVLGLPKGSDWVLYGPYSDKTLMRNYLTLNISRQLGMYSSRAKFVEVYFKNYNNSDEEYEYVGVYVLLEKVKYGKNRVNITKIKKTDNEIPCSFILELSPERRVKDSAVYSNSSLPGVDFVYLYPKQNAISEKQKSWIMNYINSFEEELYSKNFNPETGYQKYIDINSFVDFILLNELVKNNDAFFASTYIHKDKNDKMKAGPPWDYNFSMGNNKYQNPETTWYIKNNSRWVKILFEDTIFRQKYRNRWIELRKDVLSTESILNLIDEKATLLENPQKRNFDKWPILGKKIWPNQKPIPNTYDAEIEQLKSWIDKRLNWMDNHVDKLLTLERY